MDDNMGNHGGRRWGAGRPPGSRNKETLAREERAKNLSQLARENTESALAALVEVAQDISAPAAASALLDRGWGRPPRHKQLYGRFEKREERDRNHGPFGGNFFKGLIRGE